MMEEKWGENEEGHSRGRRSLLLAGAFLVSASATAFGAQRRYRSKPSLSRPSVRRLSPDANQDDPPGIAATDRGSSNGIMESIPPISELVVDEEVQGDISWMVDFAIIGNAKCGTTFLMHWLARNDDTFVHNGEVCALSKDRPLDVVSKFCDHVSDNGRMARTSDGHKIKGGLKCPKEINTEHGLTNWARCFPETKFIVTTRHPVWWFQSFYNCQACSACPNSLPHPNALIGACCEASDYLCTSGCGHDRPGSSKVCTDRSNFHHSLSRLGKTSMSSRDEMALLDHGMSIVPVKGKIFLMQIDQLFPDNPSSKNLKEDTQDFLGLDYDLRPLHERQGTGANNHEYGNEDKRKAFIDICDEEFSPVRDVLVRNGREAAQWIRDYFMKSPDVVVSSPDLFVELLEKWGEDPCQSSQAI